MLKLNLDHILKARGIEKSFTYMTKLGFTNIMAHKFKTGNYNRPPLKHIEKLCIALHCTPNDLFEWSPDPQSGIPADHPMQNLKRDNASASLASIIRTMPLDQINEIQKIIEEQNKKA